MKNFAYALLLLLLPVFLSAQQDFKLMQNDAVFRKMAEEIAQNTRTIACTFTQEKHLSFMEKPVLSEGKFYFSSDNQLRWEYTAPFSYVILMRADQLTIIDAGKRSDMSMTEQPAFKKIQKLLGTVLRGDMFAAASDFKMTFLENASQYKIHLDPLQQDMKQYINAMDLYFDKSDNMLAAFEMHEQGGDMTRTVFTSRKINSTLPAGIFTPEH